ncbi:hypothetical protein HJFPF1_07214 [Paramyrothecium foliicola]|nr:hypothetical protein HJFPF1_07214 [Paramyrothecium foliicola]
MASKTPAPSVLPIELWHTVLQYMKLQPPELDQSTPLSEDFRSRRAVLRELCLTSRWFLDLARPYLYETIVLVARRHAAISYATGANSVLLLARTLTQSHELRPLIRNLALFIPLSADFSSISNIYANTVPVWKKLSTLLQHLDPADSTIYDAVNLSITSTSDSVGDEVNTISAQHLERLVPRLVAALLRMTFKLDRLLLQGLLTQQSQEFDQTLQNLMNESAANTPFLPDLKILQLQADSSILEGNGSYGWEVSSQAQASLPLLSHPGLQSIHIASNWTSHLAVTERVVQGIARLQDMKLVVSTGLASVETLVRLLTSVKSLSVTLLSPTPSASGRDSDLNEMLFSRADTLENFSLDTTLCSAEHAADQLGPLEKVTCLPRLQKLKHLSIEPHLLIDWLEVNTWPRFLRTLPPNVVWLTFRFMPEHGQDLLRIWARSGLGSVLRSPREKWQSQLPHLRHIHLHPLPFSLRTVHVIKDDLAECGITLTWQLLEQTVELPLSMARLTIH